MKKIKKYHLFTTEFFDHDNQRYLYGFYDMEEQSNLVSKINELIERVNRLSAEKDTGK